MEVLKKKIAILELDNKNHASLIYNWICIANLNNWDVLLFTNEDIYQNVKSEVNGEQYSTFLKREDESIIRFLWRVKNYLQVVKTDFLVVLTMQSFFIEYLIILTFKTKIGVTIHNSRTWFYKNRISKPSHLIKRLIRKIWLRKASFFVVNSEAMKQYLNANFIIIKDIIVMPFSLRRSFICSKEKENGKIFTVVYPGMVSKTRKRYASFLRLAKDNLDVQFVLLGSPNKNEGGDEIIEEIIGKKLKNVKYFLNYINPEEFAENMNQSSLLFTDLNVEYINSDFNEVYGITKDSGISYLMYEFNKPAFLNSEFKNLDYLKDGTFYFDNASDLLAKFKNLKSESKIIIDTQKRLSNSIEKVNLITVANKIAVL